MNDKAFTVIIDLKGVGSKKEAFQRFQDYFQFAYPPGNNGNAFFDSVCSLDTESKTLIEKFRNKEWPKAIHLIIKNTYDLANISEKEYYNFLDLLVDSTDKKNRYDDLALTFEVDNSDYK